MIYFEEDTQAQLWSRFVPLLTAWRATSCIGHSERVCGPAAASHFDKRGYYHLSPERGGT